MSTAAAEAGGLEREGGRALPRVGTERGLGFGFLAMVPLFVVYEIVQRSGGWEARNSAEYVLASPLRVFGEHAPLARAILLLGLAAWCVRVTFQAEFGLVPRVARIALEGLVAALLFGPLLIVLARVSSLSAPALGATAPHEPALLEALHHVSGAAFEEILFRVGLQSLLCLAFVEVGRFFTAGERFARVLAEPAAILAGAFVFAAAHLAVVVAPFGRGGEPFDESLFWWRTIAGVLLGILFRVRGPGVAAWTHACFNFALFVGAGPDVFL